MASEDAEAAAEGEVAFEEAVEAASGAAEGVDSEVAEVAMVVEEEVEDVVADVTVTGTEIVTTGVVTEQTNKEGDMAAAVADTEEDMVVAINKVAVADTEPNRDQEAADMARSNKRGVVDTAPKRKREVAMVHNRHQLGEAMEPAQHNSLKHNTELSNRAVISNKQTLMEAEPALKQALLTHSKRQQRPTQRLQLQLQDTIRQGTEHSNLLRVLTALVRPRKLLLNSNMAPIKQFADFLS